MMIRLRAWLRWRHDLRQLRRDAFFAHGRWTRARHIYHDLAVVFGKEPGAWGDAGPLGKALDEMTDTMNEYLQLAARVERAEEAGPGWTT